MRKVELTGGRALTQADLNRSGALPREVMDAAEDIVRDVRDRGDAAVREYCTRFDGACPESFRVPDELVKAAPSMVDPEFWSRSPAPATRSWPSTRRSARSPGSPRARTGRCWASR